MVIIIIIIIIIIIKVTSEWSVYSNVWGVSQLDVENGNDDDDDDVNYKCFRYLIPDTALVWYQVPYHTTTYQWILIIIIDEYNDNHNHNENHNDSHNHSLLKIITTESAVAAA